MYCSMFINHIVVLSRVVGRKALYLAANVWFHEGACLLGCRI